jgi:ABC-type phosphate transport system substrate-binding protein
MSYYGSENPPAFQGGEYVRNSIIYIDKLYQKEKIHRKHMKIIKDANAVSTVVASLMLIMVVAGSAAFLSKMMQDMNSQTDKVAGKSTSADRTSMKINIISSDLAKPAVEPLVEAYNNKSLGVFLKLQESETMDVTSNISISEVGTGIADIGVSDRLPSPDEMGKYPDLVAQKLGTSGIVVIVNDGTGGPTNFDSNTLKGYYNYTDHTRTAYQMSGLSGTQKAFLQYIGIPSISSSITMVTGSAGMLDTVKKTSHSIGFTEFGYVNSQDKLGNVYIAGLYNSENMAIIYANPSYSNFTQAATSSDVNNSYYPLELAHTLYFVTRGNPSLEDSFIKWTRSSEGQDIIEKNGYISYMREFN